MAHNVLLICGGGGSEHDISLRSAKYLQDKLSALKDLIVHFVEINKDQSRRDSKGRPCELRKDGLLVLEDQTIKLDFAIPCIHGPPGETGHIQAVFEMMGLPFLGCGHEASILCFNKISTKLWLQALNIPVTPFVFLSNLNVESLNEVKKFFGEHNDVFIKASEQGSSVGCYHVTDESHLEKKLQEAFTLSPFVLVEKTINCRELEIATYQYKDQLFASNPGEIVCPDKFYTYEEKYNNESKTETKTEAQGLSSVIKEEMKTYAKRAFAGLKLKDLSRIDFFLDAEGSVYLNEINTFPGHTAISLFPLMMENNGLRYQDFLTDRIYSYLKA